MIRAIVFFVSLVFALPVFAADLAWDFPSDWDKVEGYRIYFNETGQTDDPYVKNVALTELVQDGVTVIYADIESKLNMQLGESYDVFITAWNSSGESGASNIVNHVMPEGYVPSGDSLPSGTVIEIPNASITIRVK